MKAYRGYETKWVCIKSEVSAATKCSEVFMGDQPG
jgi:hypothetical protein